MRIVSRSQTSILDHTVKIMKKDKEEIVKRFNELQLEVKDTIDYRIFLQKIPSVLPPINFIKDLELRNTSTPIILKLNDMPFISESIENLKTLEQATQANRYFQRIP
ncbi:hypothetical protein ACFFRR_002504 [Megaselia abdita]